MKKAINYITGINLIIILVVLNVVLSFVSLPQLDITQDKIHSISGSTQKIIKALDDVVNVKVYLTSDLPPEAVPVAADLRLVLASMQKVNPGKLHITYYDPNKDSSAKSDAAKYGIQPLQFSSLQNDKFEIQTGYFGMVMQYNGKQEIIPVAGDVGNLEYIVTSTIKKLTSKSLPEVVVYADSDNPQGDTQLLDKYLATSYTVDQANFDDDNYTLPSSAQALIIVGRRTKFKDKAIAQITDWVNRGKGLVLLEDKVQVNGNMQARKLDDNGLDKLLADRGIAIDSKLLLDQSSSIANFRTQSGSFLTKYAYWPVIRPENINSKIPAMSGINSLTLAWASPIKLSGKAVALFSSSNQSTLDDSFSDLTPQNQTFKSDNKKYPLAALNTDGVKLVVIGDSDMIKDQFVVNNEQNLLAVLNLVDYVSADSSLLSIRSKTLKTNPIISVTDQQKNLIKYGSVAAPIIILAVTYGLIYINEKRRNQSWIKKINQ